MSGNTELIDFRPGEVEAEKDSIRRIRGLAEELGIGRPRLYGLLFEFAYDRTDEFREFAQERE